MLNAALLELRTTSTETKAPMQSSASAVRVADTKNYAAQLISFGRASSDVVHSRLRKPEVKMLRRVADIQFDVLAERLLRDTAYRSSSSAIKRSEAFPKLVAMRETAARRLIARLRAGDIRVQWFPLLKTITNVDPVPPSGRGNIAEMTASWLQWADSTSL